MNKFLLSNTVIKRIISSLILICIALFSLFSNQYTLIVVLLIIIALLTHEWVQITEKIDGKLIIFTRILLNIIIFLLSILSISWSLLFYIIITFINLISKNNAKINSIYIHLGPLYVSFPLIFMYSLYTSFDKGLFIIIWCLLIVWFTDTFAFIGGSYFKGKKLCPNISPNKTWSGFISGIIAAIIISISVFILYQESIFSAIILGFFVSLSAQAGDLIESYVKRVHSIKDSGNLIPGHGGMLDRLDSTLFALCIIYIGYKLIS